LVRVALVWKIQLDTYRREVERYGGHLGMQYAEQLFFADSECVLEILEGVSGDPLADARWRLAIKGIDALLSDLGFGLTAKLSLMKSASDSFAREFHFTSAPLRHQIGRKFRKEKLDLELMLDAERMSEHPLYSLFEVFERRTEAWNATMRQLQAAEQEDSLADTRENLALSYIHMFANRLLRSSPRQQELLIYDFLRRLYESQFARRKRSSAG
jgi:thiopeptide-type bacteriocin biosynthesis protein